MNQLINWKKIYSDIYGRAEMISNFTRENLRKIHS